MKNYIIIILTISTLLLNVGCEDFLERNPPDQLSSEAFWETESDADRALVGVYSRLTGFATDHHRLDWDAMSDDFYMFGFYGRVDNLAKGLIEPTSGGIVEIIYDDCYSGISSCNIFLANIDQVVMDQAKIDTYKGEVLFLRALFYFTLTEFYGGVPVHLEPLTYLEATVKQKTKAEVISQVIADLDLAIQYLPDVLYNGHAVKGSALALKAKVLMHNERWSEAAAAANQVIQSNVFSLYNNYPAMFVTAGQSNNPEIMFSTKFLNPDSYIPETPDAKYAGGAALNARQDFIDEFECTDGLAIDVSPLYDPVDYKLNRDPRLDYSIRSWDEPFVKSDGSEVTVNPPGPNGLSPYHTDYLIKKYINADNLPATFDTRSDQDYILLRYAELLLIYAESKNEADGPDQSVYDAVNEVRARTGVDMPPLPAGLDKTGMRDRIRHERRVELAVEGHRYLDLKRWKTAETVIPSIIDPGGIARQFDPTKHYVFPFPQSEVDANPNLVQNPKY